MTGRQLMAVLLKRGVVRKIGEDDYAFTSSVMDDTKVNRFKKLVKDALVPYQLRSSNGGKYLATRQSTVGVNTLTHLITVQFVPYDTIVAVVKDYYADRGQNKITLSKLLAEGLVESMCENHKNGEADIPDGSTTTMM